MGRKSRHSGDFSAAIIEILKESSTKKDITHACMAKFTRIPRSSVTKILNNNMALTVETLLLLCEALDLKASDVVAEAERRISPVPASSNLVEFLTPPQPTPEQLAKMAAKRDPLGEEIYEDT